MFPLVIFYTINAIGLCFCLFLRIRIDVAYKNHMKIVEAISKYGIEQVRLRNFSEDPLDFYDQIEPFNKAIWRLWDFSYKNIVPKDIYEKIEPFISK